MSKGKMAYDMREAVVADIAGPLPGFKADPALSTMELIRMNWADKQARHLLLISESNNSVPLLGMLDMPAHQTRRPELVVLHGSPLPADAGDDYVLRQVSRVIECMKNGDIVVLKSLDRLYGALYDMLNQNYQLIGQQACCHIAHGQYSSPWQVVHENFRCIVMVSSSDVPSLQPPFLNRFEKHIVSWDMLTRTPAETDILSKLKTTITRLRMAKTTEGKMLARKNEVTFAGFSENMMLPSIASVVVRKYPSASSEEQYTHAFNLLSSLMWPESAVLCRGAAEMRTQFLNAYSESHPFDDLAGLLEHSRSSAPTLSEVHLVREGSVAGARVADSTARIARKVVLTKSPISTPLFKPPEAAQGTVIVEISEITRETELESRVMAFVENKNKEVHSLVIRCDGRQDSKKVSFICHCVDEAIRKAKQFGAVNRVIAVVMTVPSIADAKLNADWSLNFFGGWDPVTLEHLHRLTFPIRFVFCLVMFMLI